MTSRSVLLLLFLLKISFCDCSNLDPSVGPDVRNQSITGLGSVQIAVDIASEMNVQFDSEVDQFASESDLNEETSEGAFWSSSSGSWGNGFFYDDDDAPLICPTDADTCVTFAVSVNECQMNSSTPMDAYCYCTSDCLFFGDCCYGYTEATGQPGVMTPERRYWGCTNFSIGIEQNTACIYNFLIVSKCPSSANMDPDLVRRCEQPMANDTVFFDSKEIFYRNRYCALCHGVTSSELTPYIIFAPCQNNLSSEDLFCGQQPSKINESVPPDPRSCVDDSSIVSQCESQMGASVDSTLCSSETERVMIGGSIYKNIDYATCNGILVDNVTGICKSKTPDSSYDPVFNTAYYYPQLQCTNGLRLSGTECVPEVSSWPDCRNRSFIFTATTNGSLQCFDGFNGFETLQVQLNIGRPVLTSYTLNGSATTVIELPADILPHKSQLEDLIENSLEEIRNQRCQDNKITIRERCNIIEDELFKGDSSNISSIVDDPHLFEPVQINGTVYIMYNNTTFMTPLLWENDTYYARFSKEWNFSKELSFSLYGRVVDIDTCASIVVGDSLITEKEKDNITYLIYQDISFPPERYVRYKNGSVRLCWTEPDPPEPVNMFLYSEWQHLLNDILFALSSICLMATLCTYCIFKTLRNLQGIYTMNFVFALLVGQVMLQFIDPIVTSLPSLCATAAVITHYFLLAVFTWTNILAWDLVRHFASSSFLPKRQSEKRRLIVYLTIGWCLPLIIIISCLVVQRQNPLLFRYGKIGKTCWIYQSTAIVLAFMVPVAFSFIVNIVLFSFTAHGVRKSKRDSSVLREGIHEQRKELFKELVVHFKISCLLGFGWSFGFIAAFAQAAAVWTIFIITSSLQGIFVFIFFGANQRVRSLWRKRIYGSRARGRSTTSSGTLSTVTSTTSVGWRGRSKQKLVSSCSTTRV